MNDVDVSKAAGSAAAWGSFVGAETAALLQRMVADDRVPHALLITGPPQVGKAQIALSLAQALNCEATGQRPCGRCRPCERIAASKHADVEIVAPGGICRVADHDHSRSRTIGICAIRRLEMVAATQPFEGRQRVFIVDPADALSAEAADAFLKTLEEPPSAVSLLLVTSRAGLLSETVLSRCRRLAVAPLPLTELMDWLCSEHDVGQEEAETLARIARGRAGWATQALQEGEPLALRRAQTEEIRRISHAGRSERFAYAESLAGRGADPANALTALAHWLDWWRDLLLIVEGCEDRIVHRDQRDELSAEAGRLRARDICNFLIELQRTEQRLRLGVSPRLAMDGLLLQIPSRGAAPVPAGV